jgi:hypothetical protein
MTNSANLSVKADQAHMAPGGPMIVGFGAPASGFT